jgi:hypothetical protein
MSITPLWVASIKAKVLENCELDNDGSEFQYVEAFLAAEDSDALLNQAKTTLSQMGLEFTELLKLSKYNPEDWYINDDPLMVELLQEAAEQAKNSTELTFGPFTSSQFFSTH